MHLRVCITETNNPYRMWQGHKENYAVVNFSTRLQLDTRLSRILADE